MQSLRQNDDRSGRQVGHSAGSAARACAGKLPLACIRRRQAGWPAGNASRSDAGWTLMELLIVIAIIALLALLGLLVNWKKSIFRANDARRKTDLANIRRSFEEYYNDHNCYPDAAILDNCGGTGLAPYLAKIPCDPATREGYKYQPDSDTNTCLGNRVCAKLQDWNDPDITTLGCDAQAGCGWGAYWNYCLATGTTVTAPGFIPGQSPTPIPTPTPYYDGPFACWKGTPTNTCKNLGIGGPEASGCPRGFGDSNCLGMCASHPELVCP